MRVPLLVWGIVGFLSAPTIAHSSHHNPYVDPDQYKDERIGLRQFTPFKEVEDGAELSDDLAIEVKGGKQKVEELANRYGLQYIDQIFEKPDVFHLRHSASGPERRKRSKRELFNSEDKLIRAIASEPGVEWVDQQIAFTREKRHVPKTRVISNHENHYMSNHDKADRPHLGLAADPLDVKEVLGEVISRYSDEASEVINPSRKFIIGEEEQNIDDIALNNENKRGHPHGRSQSHHRESIHHNLQDDSLVRVPLSRNVGYTIGLAKARVQHRRQYTDYDSSLDYRLSSEEHESGRLYTEREFHQENKEKNMPSSNEEGQREQTPNNISSDETDEEFDFGGWIDNMVANSMNFDDPLYKDQWYLHNTGQLGRSGHDLNVTWAWLKGYTGKGIVLSVLDDGLQRTNADIAKNYAPEVSYSLVHDGAPMDDPYPRIDPSFTNSHGTYCAAVMAAVANNSVCGVGVAYDSRVGGVRLVDGKVTDLQEATALSRHLEIVDIFSASWGPTDDGTKVEGPARLAHHAFVEGTRMGRGGKGVIYVWASGNGGAVGDNCNLDGYTSSIYTLSVSALTDIGTSTFYEEPCASTLAAVYVGGEHTLEEAYDKKLRETRKLNVVVPELDGHCSENFQGTSAAAPLMAGVVALVLQANGNLTWRDMQHLVVETSTPTPSALQESGWSTNGRGKLFHPKQGFGAVNAGRMVEAALTWENVKPQKVIVLPMFNGHRDFHPFDWMNVSRKVDSSDVSLSNRMTSIEQVVATIDLIHSERRRLKMFIVSPSGTTSQVLTHRASDNSTSGFKSWGFMSVHFWGEDPEGIWKVAMKDDSGIKGFLKKIELSIYGS